MSIDAITTTQPAGAEPAAQAPLSRVPRPWVRWIGVALTVLGWWLSYDLYQIGAGHSPTNPLLERLCGAADDGTAGGCGSVVGSEYGYLPLSRRPGALSIPVSAIGMGYFAFVGFWYLIIGCPTRSRWAWHFVLMAVVAVGCLQSLEYVRIMHDELKQWCAGCVMVHIINAALGLTTLAAFPWLRERERYEPHPRGRLVIAVFAGGAFLFLLHGAKATLDAVSIYAGRLGQKYKTLTSDPDFVLWDYARKPVVKITTDPDEWIGPADAPHELVVFLDYQCSACREAHQKIHVAMERHPKALRVAFRNFPLDRTCNEYVEVGKHSHACAAAKAAEAARALGGAEAFLRMKDLLYERQSALGVADYGAWAEEIGLDGERFERSRESDAVTKRIEADIEAGHEAGVSTTPALFLDGRQMSYWTREETWDALLAAPALASQPRSSPATASRPPPTSEPRQSPKSEPRP